MQGFEFCCPTKIVCGAHALDKLPDEVADRGMKHPLVMTDAGLVKLGVSRDDLHAVAKQARYDGAALYNETEITLEDAMAVLEAAY